MIEYINIALLIVGVVSVGTGITIFFLLRFIRRQDERLKLIMKTLYLNTKGVKSVGEKTDQILEEQLHGIDYPRKSFDHNRVLVSSLNRQLKHIELALYNSGHIDQPAGTDVNPHGAQQSSSKDNVISASSHPSGENIHQNANHQTEKVAHENGITLLKSLFEEKRLRKNHNLGNQQKAAKLSSIFAKQEPAENQQMSEEPRRAFNG